jgi:hypothetical protein
VEELPKKYKDTVLRAELPDTPPTRTIDVEAEIEFTDESPVARKQFRLSAEVKEAVREWACKQHDPSIQVANLVTNLLRPQSRWLAYSSRLPSDQRPYSRPSNTHFAQRRHIRGHGKRPQLFSDGLAVGIFPSAAAVDTFK